MKKFELCRSYLPDRTVGIFKHEDFKLKSLELPWRNNLEDKSCVKEGVYLVVPDSTGKHKWFSIQDVEGRTDIEIHVANYLKDINGCVGLGMELGRDYNIYNSKAALESLVEYTNGESFLLHIRAATAEDWV
tara:strand:- start:880 stop:1275 length:396 start_codon:yes stop_codon:yes gene_type:complete